MPPSADRTSGFQFPGESLRIGSCQFNDGVHLSQRSKIQSRYEATVQAQVPLRYPHIQTDRIPASAWRGQRLAQKDEAR